MSKIFQLLLLTSIFCVNFVFAQSETVPFRLKGTIVDQDLAVVPALSLFIRNGDKVFGSSTDINGRFDIALSTGNYEIDSSEAELKLFLKISEFGPNPQNLNLTVNSSKLCLSESKTYSYPRIIKSFIPDIPAAAQAVRVSGRVSVQLHVSPDGRVTSAQAISGHPLLRGASERAAKQFEFEAVSTNDVRKVLISFDFTEVGSIQDVKRFECPYRIIVPLKNDVLIESE